MDLLIDQVVQFEEILIAHGNWTLELLTGATIKDDRLTRAVQTCTLEHFNNVRLAGAIKDWGRERHTFVKVACKLD